MYQEQIIDYKNLQSQSLIHCNDQDYSVSFAEGMCKNVHIVFVKADVYKEINWYRQNHDLVYKSRTIDTGHVYNGDIPSLHGRKFDLAVFNYPRPDIKDCFYVINNGDIDLDLPVEIILQTYNVVFMCPIMDFVFDMQQYFDVNILNDMKASCIF